MPEDYEAMIERVLSEKPLIKAVEEIVSIIYDQAYKAGYVDGQAEERSQSYSRDSRN